MFAPDSYETTLTTVLPTLADDYSYVIKVEWERTEQSYFVTTPVDLSALSLEQVLDMLRTLLPRDEGGRVLEVREV